MAKRAARCGPTERPMRFATPIRRMRLQMGADHIAKGLDCAFGVAAPCLPGRRRAVRIPDVDPSGAVGWSCYSRVMLHWGGT